MTMMLMITMMTVVTMMTLMTMMMMTKPFGGEVASLDHQRALQSQVFSREVSGTSPSAKS